MPTNISWIQEVKDQGVPESKDPEDKEGNPDALRLLLMGTSRVAGMGTFTTRYL